MNSANASDELSGPAIPADDATLRTGNLIQ